MLKDSNGQQVTYNGHPLYTFADDHTSQVTGQGFQNFFVATPGLAPIASNSAPAERAFHRNRNRLRLLITPQRLRRRGLRQAE